MLIAAVVDFGNVFLLQNQMTEVAREAARRIATNRLDPDGALTFVSDQLAEKIEGDIGVVVTETPIEGEDGVDLTVSVAD
jgi:Flp pilus assembly protein TadG